MQLAMLKKISLLSSVILIFLFVFSSRLEANPGSPLKNVQEITLKNGMKFLLLHREGAPVFSAYIRVRVGGIDEQSGQTGIAHLLEHMAFKGTSQIGTQDYHREKKLLEEIENLHEQVFQAPPEKKQALHEQLQQKIEQAGQLVDKEAFSRIYMRNGASNLNATTSQDLTSYFVTLPSNKLELWAFLESSRLKDPVFREFYSELDVVLEERRMRVEDSPFGKLYEKFKENAFKESLYQRPTIGYAEDIKKLSAKDLRQFYQRYYVPSNMVGTLVGNFNVKETKDILRRYFEELEAGKSIPKLKDKEPEPKAQSIIKIQYDASPIVMIGYLKPTLPHPDDYSFDVFHQIFCEGRSSRLYQRWVVKDKLASNVGCSSSVPGARLNNLYFIYASVQKGQQAQELLDTMDEEIQDFIEKGPSLRELKKAKKGLLSDWYYQMQGNKNIAEQLSYYEVLTGTWKYILEHPKKISEISQEDLIKLAKKYLNPKRRQVGILESTPKEKAP